MMSDVGFENTNIRDIIQEHQRGTRLSFQSALALSRVEGQDFFNLLSYANQLCEIVHGKRVSFVVNRNINFTNVCAQQCRFCAFSVAPNDPRAFLLTQEEIAHKVDQAQTAGCTEVCIQGGLHPDLNFNYYLDILKSVRSHAPAMHVHAFSPQEISYMSQKSGLSIKEVMQQLQRAGLGSMPGTAAEILVDQVRRRLCPKKISTQQWIDIIKTAHQASIPTTSTIMFGSIETWEDRCMHLQVIRDIQDATHGFTEFIPLAFINPHNGFTAGLNLQRLSGPEILKLYAIARIFFYGSISNVQTSWVKLGPTFAQVTLDCGVNDFGGTLMEENISKSAGAQYGEYLSPDEIKDLIRGVGKMPIQRGTTYEIIREF